jgi:23S rRNA (pseudouridine1915-N3)-methyltransferase
MKIQIIRIGRPAHRETADLVAMYEKRLQSFAKVESVEWKTLPTSAAKGKGAATFPKAPGEFLVVLDQPGEQWTSEDFAKQLGKWQDDPRIKTLTFLIGGPWGLDDAARDAADKSWSLSKATFPADLAWVMTWEQVYRAFTILRGMPYHHG